MSEPLVEDQPAGETDAAPALQRFEEAWASLIEAVPLYERSFRAVDEKRTPAVLCRDILAGIEAILGAGDEEAFAGFIAWAQDDRRGAGPALKLLDVIQAEHAKAAGDWDTVFAAAKRAMARDHRDTHAQALFNTARAHRGDGSAVAGEDLSDRFCARPFEELELRANGDVYTCCSAWLPVPIGNFREAAPEAIWNSATAQAVRRSILDGSFRYCSRVHCPMIVNRQLMPRDRPTSKAVEEIIATGRTVMPGGPRRVLMSQDRSCNLSCPSCRTKRILAPKAEQDRLNELAETTILPLLKDAREVKVTGSGDPFASGHFRYLLKRLSSGDFPKLAVQIQTNGVLLDERAWDELALDGLVSSIWVSIDAARRATYAIVRRDGDFDRLMANLVFMGKLRRQRRIGQLRLDFVVQALNFREMPAAAEIARHMGFDGLYFQMIRNWGTFASDAFQEHLIGAPDHPDYDELLEVLRHPSLAPPFVDMSNMRRLYESAQRPQPAAAPPSSGLSSSSMKAEARSSSLSAPALSP